MSANIRTEVDDANRIYWILSDGKREGEPRLRCPMLHKYGQCGMSDICSRCKRI